LYVQTQQIVALLIEERDRLSRAIEALQGNAPQGGRQAGGQAVASHRKPAAKPKRTLSAAGRRAIAEAARRRWAAVRAAKEKSAPAKAEPKQNKKARG
jgi:hypothetical protein